MPTSFPLDSIRQASLHGKNKSENHPKKQKLNFNHFALAKCTRFPRTTILGMDDELELSTKPCPYLSPCVNSNALERTNSAPRQSGSRNRLHVMCGAGSITWLFNCWNTKKKHQISHKKYTKHTVKIVKFQKVWFSGKSSNQKRIISWKMSG